MVAMSKVHSRKWPSDAPGSPVFLPARSVVVSRLGPNGLEIKKEATHDLV